MIYIYIFSFLRGERERNKDVPEKHSHQLPLARPQLEDLAGRPGVCPDWELNWRPLSSQAGTQSTEPHQAALFASFWKISYLSCVGLFLECIYPIELFVYLGANNTLS